MCNLAWSRARGAGLRQLPRSRLRAPRFNILPMTIHLRLQQLIDSLNISVLEFARQLGEHRAKKYITFCTGG
ncbi:hypothetical protein [Spirosoma telluris]|uniref:hypothetical protein n=1 Tax=Spirosoma telluris TaxID=2183553 RepID=UPI002FC3A052